MVKRKATHKIVDEIDPGFSERSARGRLNNEKGKEWERAVAKILKRHWKDARRLFGQAREGHEVPDIGGTPFWVECAKGSTNAIHEKLAQGLADSPRSPNMEYRDARVLVIAHHGGKKPPTATMRLEDFLELLELLR